MICKRINNQVTWYQGFDDERVRKTVQSMLNEELTPEAAVQLAFMNNPKIQAIFEKIGIAQADLVEAGLLSNPMFEIDTRYPNHTGLKTNIEYLITTSLLDIVLIPLRKKVAATEFEQTKMRVANEILGLAFDVRETYYELLSEIQKIQYLRSIVELTRINFEIVVRQYNIGNVNVLDFQLAHSKYFENELEMTNSNAELIRLREKLNRLLGITEDICLLVPENFPNEDYRGYKLCDLIEIALEERLDLQAAWLDVRRLRQTLGLKQWWKNSNLQAGVSGERETDGTNVIGPGFSGEVPLFNYGQAARYRLYSQLRQAQDNIAALEIQVISEVKEAHKLLMCHLKTIENYRNQVIPIQNAILDSSNNLYNVMGMGVDRLLENKKIEMMICRNYIEGIKKYFTARVRLDRALGGNLYRLLDRDLEIAGEAR
jgi:cobalt-zinc-cadmium efflux system outer membrane protein